MYIPNEITSAFELADFQDSSATDLLDLLVLVFHVSGQSLDVQRRGHPQTWQHVVFMDITCIPYGGLCSNFQNGLDPS